MSCNTTSGPCLFCFFQLHSRQYSSQNVSMMAAYWVKKKIQKKVHTSENLPLMTLGLVQFPTCFSKISKAATAGSLFK